MNAIVKHEGVSAPSTFTQDQIDLIKTSLCKGLSDDEFKVFLYTCQRTGLDPFAKQVYCVKRGNQMTIQTGIDGYRLVADRSGKYAPGQEPTYVHDANGKLLSATAYVKKLTKDGTWHVVPATAHFDEYVQVFNNKPAGLWLKMPRTMLAKCAEALAIRKCFPAELSGVYTKEEMDQADVVEIHHSPKEPIPIEYITEAQEHHLNLLIAECDPAKLDKIWAFLAQKCDGKGLSHLKKECFPKIEALLVQRRDEYQSSLLEKPTSMDEVADAETKK